MELKLALGWVAFAGRVQDVPLTGLDDTIVTQAKDKLVVGWNAGYGDRCAMGLDLTPGGSRTLRNLGAGRLGDL